MRVEKILVVVDMQKDFVDGALGSKEAISIVPKVVEKIKNFDGKIFVTYDTHFEDYLSTLEGKKLPVIHCVKDTEGWQLNTEVFEALKNKEYTTVLKNTFGSTKLPSLIKEAVGEDEFLIEVIGLCTDICVVSNVLILKANFPETTITVDSSCCAGVTQNKHEVALETMRSCHIDVI